MLISGLQNSPERTTNIAPTLVTFSDLTIVVLLSAAKWSGNMDDIRSLQQLFCDGGSPGHRADSGPMICMLLDRPNAHLSWAFDTVLDLCPSLFYLT